MIANPDKFHSIILSKNRIDTSGLKVKVGNKVIKSETNVLLGVKIDKELNFNSHVSDLCKTASAQLNDLFRFKNILSFKAKFILTLFRLGFLGLLDAGGGGTLCPPMITFDR